MKGRKREINKERTVGIKKERSYIGGRKITIRNRKGNIK
jgi:hypothetical protein